MEMPLAVMSASDIKRQNLGKKKRADMTKWKDRVRKALRDAGKPYLTRRGEKKTGKNPPKD
ncbi:hypothetical protein M9458_055461, partial [Cirrhinus mrigala]